MCSGKMAVSRDEAKRILRRLELEAYSSIISVFRAQGDLNRDKKKILTDLGLQLSISTERHRAEIRRAYSDDRLGAVADCIYGPSTCAEWAAEGRRLVPLMPRLVPQTVLTATATAAANSAAALNARVPPSASSQGKSAASSASNGLASTVSSISPGAAKALALKLPSNPQGSLDGEFEGEDGKIKKRRRLSQSIPTPKPVQKIVVTTANTLNKPNMKTTSVSTMTKGNKPGTTPAAIKVPPKVSLPASASQVKLLTKTVSITQTVCQAKTMLNYKTVSATSPATMKVQTVMSNTAPKAQFKVAVPPSVSPTKTLLVPKAHVSTSPGKPVVGLALPKTGMTTAQILAKQRSGKQAARFKPLPGTVKFKSLTPATMGSCSTVTMVTPSPSVQSFPVAATPTLPVSSTQPIVKIIQVPGTGGLGISKPVVVMTSGINRVSVPGTLPVSAATRIGQTVVSPGISALKVPISSTSSAIAPPLITMTTQASRPGLQHLPTSVPKTVVMTTMIDGSKKVVLSLPAPVIPIQAKSAGATSSVPPQVSTTPKTQGLAPLLMPLPSSTVPTTTAPKKTSIPSLECTEPSSVLQGPTPIAPKPSTAPTTTTQVRTRPLTTILPAPFKHTPSSPLNTATTNCGGRKFTQILPAPSKSVPPGSMLVPIVPSPAPVVVSTVVTHAPVAKVAKPIVTALMQPAVMNSKVPPVAYAQSVPTVSSKTSTTGKDTLAKAEPDHKMVNEKLPGTTHGGKSNVGKELDVEESQGLIKERGQVSETVQEHLQIKEKKREVDVNESSEDESIDLVCSETIDSTTGHHDTSPRQVKVPKMAFMESTQADLATQPPVNMSANASHDHSNVETKRECKVLVEHLTDIPLTGILPKLNLPVNLTANQHLGTIGHISSIVQSDFHPGKQILPGIKSDLPEKRVVGKKESVENKFDLPDELIKSALSEDTGNLPDFAAVSSFLQSFSEEQIEKGSLATAVTPSEGRPAANSTVDAFSFHEAFPESCTPIKHMDLPYQMQANKDSQESPESVFGFTSSSGSSEIGDIAFAIDPNSSSSDHSLEGHSLQTTVADPLDINVEELSSHSSTGDDKELTESEKLALEAIANVRTSGRKRKAPVPLNVSPPRQSSGWVRGALSVLQKVCSYRGQGRRKGDISAASWFLRPVDPNDAPGYYKVISTPMDFATVKSKLENGVYEDCNDFHNDMLLVKLNCFRYNPPGHDIRNDCGEVFRFYEAEYAKMVERWEKCHVSPAKKPRSLVKPELPNSSL